MKRRLVLGVDESTIRNDSNLIDDLAAEFIDFLDISFQIQKEFGLPEIKPGDIFPAFLRELDQSTVFQGDELAPAVKQRLLKDYPFLAGAPIERFAREKEFGVFFDVSTLVAFVDYKTKHMVEAAGIVEHA